MLVKRTLASKHSATVTTHCLLIHSLVTLVNTLDVLRQVRTTTKQFLTNVTLERLLPLHLVGDAGVDELDVVAEVSGVGADSATGGTPQYGGGGGGVTRP